MSRSRWAFHSYHGPSQTPEFLNHRERIESRRYSIVSQKGANIVLVGVLPFAGSALKFSQRCIQLFWAERLLQTCPRWLLRLTNAHRETGKNNHDKCLEHPIERFCAEKRRHVQDEITSGISLATYRLTNVQSTPNPPW